MNKKFHVIYSCKFPACKSVAYRNTSNKRFYKFPKNPSRQQIWRQICHISENTRCEDYRICEDHFTSEDFLNSRRHKLCPFAIPKNCATVAHDHSYYSREENGENFDPSNGANIEETGPTSLNLINDKPEHPHVVSMQPVVLFSGKGVANNISGNTYSFLTEQLSGEISKNGILSKIGSKLKDLTPKKVLMYKVHRATLSRICKLKTVLNKERDQFKKLKTLYENNQFKVIDECLNRHSKEFINCQLKNYKKKPPAKRYTEDFKLFALSMYKRSPKLYRYLQVYFELPCPRILKKLLNSVPFDTGFNNNLLESLKSQVKTMHHMDRFCSLIFDEMKLSGGFYYCKNRQLIIGYEDLGHLGRTMQNADHAFVLMARGLRRRWKQPIAYYFTSTKISPLSIKEIVIEAVKSLKTIGLQVLGTVCDQGASNRAAIAHLCDSTHMYHFEVDEEGVDCLFDPAHLIKNTRNAMIDHLIEFEDGKFADFDHIVSLFQMDQKKTFKTLHSLHPENFNFANSYNKMKVGVAVRQLSFTVACELETYISHKKLPPEAAHTAEFVHLIDQLFDSVNGSSRYAKRQSKPLRCAITGESSHLDFWMEILPKLDRWRIIDKKTGKDVTKQFHFIDGWKVTLNSMISIWKRVQKEGFEYLCPRLLNQDPLENLFCCIRQHGAANTNPTCYQFVAALKTCVLNNLAVPSYVQSNCKDDGDPVLNNLTSLLKAANNDNKKNSNDAHTAVIEKIYLRKIINAEDCQALAYVSGYILKKMVIPECDWCKNDVFAQEITSVHLSVKLRDDGCSLTYCSEKFMCFVNSVNELICAFLKENGNRDRLEDVFKDYCLVNDIHESFFICKLHSLDMCREFYKICVPFFIYKYVNDLNRNAAHARALKKHVNKMKKFQN